MGSKLQTISALFKKLEEDADFKAELLEESTPGSCLFQLLKLPYSQLLTKALPVLHNHYDKESSIFKFGSLKIGITLEDVLYLTGLPITGKPVICERSRDPEAFERVFRRPPTKTIKLKELKAIALDRTEDKERRKRAILLMLVEAFIVTTTTGYANTTYVQLIEKLDEVNDYAWGAALLAFLHHGLQTCGKTPTSGNLWVLLGDIEMTMQKFELLLEMTMSQISSLTNSSRDVDLFSNLSSELIIDILSRLPFPTIMNCKFVCKSWLNLIETHEFAKSHKAKSVPVLAVCEYQGKTYSYHLYDFNLAVQDDQVAKLNLPCNGWIIGSADGLLFICDMDIKPHSLYICNPFTRDYTVFHYSQELDYSDSQVVTYGFGVSKLKAHHKVVRIFHDRIYNQETEEIMEVTKSECQVYTLETGTWRSIAPAAPFDYIVKTNHGVFLEGNLHWLVYDLNSCL